MPRVKSIKTGLITIFACVALLGMTVSAKAMTLIDTVNSFSPGTGYGVYDNSGGAYTGASGSGVFDATSVFALDGAVLALGGTVAAPGSIIVSFSTGSVFDGVGFDLRVYDSIGVSEGITVEASVDGTTFFGMGSDAGSGSGCSLGSPCSSDFDLSVSGLAMASFFRLTVSGYVATGFPQAYDLDTVEALNFSSVSTVPVPAALPLFATALAGLCFAGYRRRKANNAV